MINLDYAIYGTMINLDYAIYRTIINLDYAIYRKIINLDYAIYRKINRRRGPKVSGCPRVPIILSLSTQR